jgi:sugar lactone lactonase YvrE
MRTNFSFFLRISALLVLLSIGPASPQTSAQTVYTPYSFTTLSGNAGPGSTDGTRTAARFSFPMRVAVDNTGTIYVADTLNSTIRKVSAVGMVTTLAGLALGNYCCYDGNPSHVDGTGSAARFWWPSGVAVDNTGNVYVADTEANLVRKVTSAEVVTTLPQLNGGNDAGVAVDSAGNVYVADFANHAIRKSTPSGGWTTLAGLIGSEGSADGTGSVARFSHPFDVALDSVGNVYVADKGNDTIRKVTSDGVVTTLAGLAGSVGSADGTGIAARFNSPSGVAVDTNGNVYVADTLNYTIRKVTPAGAVTTLAGLAGSTGSTDGLGTDARFGTGLPSLFGIVVTGGPYGVAVDSAGNVYVADTSNNSIRKITPAGYVTTLAGNDATFNSPSGVALDAVGNAYVADIANNSIREITPSGEVTTLAGLMGSVGTTDGTGSAARFNGPSSVATDGAGHFYVADTGNNTIRTINQAGLVTTLAGLAGTFGSADGTGSLAQFSYPSSVAVDSMSNVYVADTGNYTIRKVTSAGVVTTLAGLAGSSGNADGTGTNARFWFPQGVAVDSAGNIYVADSENATIRKVTQAGVVTTLAGMAGLENSGSLDGTGTNARFRLPQALSVDSLGNVYVADSGNNDIRKVTPAGMVTTLGGQAGSSGNADGTASAARFNSPSGIAVDSYDNLVVGDTGNNTIRHGYPAVIITPSGPDFGFIGGQFGFALAGPRGPPGPLVVVDASTDLMTWLPVWTNNFSGTLNFIDPQPGLFSHRFYRATLPYIPTTGQ